MSITLHIHDIVCAVTVQPECVYTMSCVLACACDPCMLVCMQNYSLNLVSFSRRASGCLMQLSCHGIHFKLHSIVCNELVL